MHPTTTPRPAATAASLDGFTSSELAAEVVRRVEASARPYPDQVYGVGCLRLAAGFLADADRRERRRRRPRRGEPGHEDYQPGF